MEWEYEKNVRIYFGKVQFIFFCILKISDRKVRAKVKRPEIYFFCILKASLQFVSLDG